jgi:glycosyltransferase involved in cell wall biosynthesis
VRVLHVLATDQMRGAEVFASDLIRVLEREGVDQRTVVLRSGRPFGPGISPTRSPHANRRVIPGLRISLPAARRLGSAIEDSDADVILAHGGEALKYSVLARARGPAPLVYRRIGLSPRWIRRGPRRLMYQTLMRRASKVVAVAEAVRAEAIQRFSVPPDDVVTIPNAVDPIRLKPSRGRGASRASLSIPAAAPVILSVGALTWEKDPFTHVEVGSRVLADVSDAVHVFVGDGPLREEMRRRLIDGGSSDRSKLIGSRDDMGDVFALGDLVLFASRSDGMEGMPAVAIEAGMSGLPVAAFAVPGMTEIVVDEQTGLLARPGDADGLTQRVMRLIGDPALSRRLGATAAARCNGRFSVDAVAPRYLDILEEVAGHARRSA